MHTLVTMHSIPSRGYPLTRGLGPSSNISFIRHIAFFVASRANSSQTWTPTVRTAPQRSEYGFTSVSRFGSPAELGNEKKTELRIDPFHLPPYGDTLKLINSFFADTGLLFPYIHKESFLNAYLAIKGSDWTKIRRT